MLAQQGQQLLGAGLAQTLRAAAPAVGSGSARSRAPAAVMLLHAGREVLQNLVSSILPYGNFPDYTEPIWPRATSTPSRADWLARLDQDPSDLDYFVGVARALVGTGEEARARSLLELLDDQLRESGHWAARLQLLKRAGSCSSPPTSSTPPSSSTLGKLYSGRRPTRRSSRPWGCTARPATSPRPGRRSTAWRALLAFDVGTVVAMEGKGVGRVVEANLGLESFKVDFERIRGLTVGFKAAPKLLRPLPPEHVLRRKLEEPAVLKALTPPELLRAVLQSYDRPLTAGEVRDILAGHRLRVAVDLLVVRGPQAPAGGGERRRRAPDLPLGGEQRRRPGLGLEGLRARRPRASKIERLRREGARDAGLRDRMAANLAIVAEAGDRHRSRPRLRDLVRHRAQRRRSRRRRRLDPRRPARRPARSGSSPASRSGCCASAPTPWCASAARTGRPSTATP